MAKSKKARIGESFTHLHTHSDMSQLDGCGKISDYVAEAKKRGHKAIAFTDHGTMRGYFNQMEACEQDGVKPIYGIEFYIAQDMTRKGLTDEEKAEIKKGKKQAEGKAAIKEYEEVHGIRARWHLTVWAKNEVGLKNLFKLSSAAYLDGFYYKPRIDLKALIENGDGLAVATGCLSSPINDRVTQGKEKAARENAEMLREAFGEDLWLEVMPHAIGDQRVCNKFMLELQKDWGKDARLLATQDAHYIHQEDAHAHEVLLCIGTGTNLSNPDRFKFDGDEFHMRSRQQMWDAFKKHHEYMPDKAIKESLDNTMVFQERVDSELLVANWKGALLPPIDMPEKYSQNTTGQFQYLRDLCLSGWEWRDIPSRAEFYAKREGITYEEAIKKYSDQLKMELGALMRQKFVPYFLLVRDLYEWVRKQKIMCGPGRGSAAGSIVSYLIGITSVDPVEHGLLFERFISPSRIDMPDIDMDFEDVRRQEIIQHIKDKYGLDKTAQIATVGKLSGKQCLKDVARTLEVPYAEVNEVTSSIIERSSGDERASQTIADSFKEFKVCRDFNKKYPDVLKYSKRLEGMTKNLGIHAAGVIASPVPLTELVPLETRKYEGRDVIVTAGDMYAVAAAGLVKLDVLGLRTLSVLNDAVKALNERHGEDVDLEMLELNEDNVLQGFTDHEYTGIFQYDSPGADKICMGVEFERFEDIAAMTALNRPGTARSGLATQFVERKKNPEKVKEASFHPKVSEITSDTLGIIVYQEHVLKIFTEVAGFAPATADSLRKTIAKKIGDETLGKERVNFIAGSMKLWGPEGTEGKGMTKKIAGKIMDAITFFGSYGFNKSHATAYGVIAYWGMWLKVNYPIEFYWSLLKHEPSRQRIQAIAKDAKKHGIELKPPDVSYSREHFSIDPDGKSIRGSLVDIKGVGGAAAGSIMEHQPYDDFWDFLDRVDRRKVHKGVVLALTKAGAMSHIVPNTKWFVENVDKFWDVVNKNRGVAKDVLAKTARLPDYAEEERGLIAAAVNPLAFGKHPIDAYGDFIKKHVKVPIADMSHEDFWKRYNNHGVYIKGVIVEVKYNQIGDFNTGDLPSEEERRMMFWGQRYANVNVEDPGGVQNRIKFDIDIFDDMRHLIDAGIGTPVVVHVSASAHFQNLKAHFAVDLEAYRKKIEAGEPLGVWERVLNGQHPAEVYPWKKNAQNRINNTLFKSYALGSNGRVEKGEDPASNWMTGVVTHVRSKYDRNGNLMSFFGMIGADGYYTDALCFSSGWDAEARKVVKPGRALKIQFERSWDSYTKKWSMIYDNDCMFKKIPSGLPKKKSKAKT